MSSLNKVTENSAVIAGATGCHGRAPLLSPKMLRTLVRVIVAVWQPGQALLVVICALLVVFCEAKARAT
jgi:hypothetical protein